MNLDHLPAASQWPWNLLVHDPTAALTLSSLIPPVFASYARIFHPAYTAQAPITSGDSVRSTIMWGAIARSNDRKVHRLAQFPNIAKVKDLFDLVASTDQIWDEPPAQGTLPLDLARVLADVLEDFTTNVSAPCNFGVWTGYSDIKLSANAPRLCRPGREYQCYSAPLKEVQKSVTPFREQIANLWWPTDYAWMVATDIDHVSTYVGGSAACIQALIDCAHIEAAPSQQGDRIGYAADTVNSPWGPDSDHHSWPN